MASLLKIGTIESGTGNNNWTMFINILFSCHFSGGAPKFLEKPSIKQQGGLIVMSVVVESDPEPTVKWFCGEKEVVAGGRISIRTEKVNGKGNAYRLVCEITVSQDCNNDSVCQ